MSTRSFKYMFVEAKCTRQISLAGPGWIRTGTPGDKWKIFVYSVNTYEPETAEETVNAQFAQYDRKGLSTITSEDLGDWIDAKAPHLSDEQIDHLVEGADIDGDGIINYKAYLALVCQRILKLNSAPLKVIKSIKIKGLSGAR